MWQTAACWKIGKAGPGRSRASAPRVVTVGMLIICNYFTLNAKVGGCLKCNLYVITFVQFVNSIHAGMKFIEIQTADFCENVMFE